MLKFWMAATLLPILPLVLVHGDRIFQCLLDCATEAAFSFRLACFSKAIRAGQSVLGTQVTSSEFEDLLDVLRLEVEWPIRPRPVKPAASTLLAIAEEPLPKSETVNHFRWGWFSMQVPWHDSGTLWTRIAR